MQSKDFQPLRECPFCGGEAFMVKTKRCGRYVACWDCNVATEEYDTDDIGSAYDKAIAAWNLRADHLPDATKMVSNADRIRGMSDEELADFMFSMQKTIWNVLCGQLGWRESKVTDVSENGTFFIDWLQQPAKEEHHEDD